MMNDHFSGSPQSANATPLEVNRQIKTAFDRFAADPAHLFRVRIRRERAKQIRELLSQPDAVDLPVFNREVWNFESETSLHGEPIKGLIFGDQPLSSEQVADLHAALESGGLELHGNYTWGSGARVYGSSLPDSEDQKLLHVRDALRILNDPQLAPLDKAERAMTIRGLGRNTVTGLTMVFHPDEFSIWNKKSEDAIRKIGRSAESLEEFQQITQDLRQQLGAKDALELDWFLCLISDGKITFDGAKPVSRPPELNTILYGPPGTGKTYSTLQKAVEICDGGAPQVRSELVARYNQLLHEERVAFVTFHQSYSYEDFVEGIRPVLQGEEQGDLEEAAKGIHYVCRDGVFKRICLTAKNTQGTQHAVSHVDLGKVTVWKMSLGDVRRAEDAEIFDECLENNYLLLGYGGVLNFESCESWEDIARVLRSHDPTIKDSSYDIAAVHWFKMGMAVGDLVVISDGTRRFRAIARVTGNYKYLEQERPAFRQMRPVEWVAVFEESLPREVIYGRAFSMQTLYRLNKSLLNQDALQALIGSKPQGERNYTIIIDEINRGNIAKIFGELITLLEPDKRLGAANELQVTLPYSGERFGVPKNVYVVGTMNTADRSIAFLDVALRRRFRFEELMPDPELIRQLSNTEGDLSGVDVAKLLETINARIELLYDRDHQIGHSFFLGLKSLSELRNAFCGKVIPLLQEYFYGDWAKVCLVLGCPYTESGKAANPNEHPLIQAKLLDPAKLGVTADEFVESKLRFDVSLAFVNASSDAELLPYFEGIVSQARAD